MCRFVSYFILQSEPLSTSSDVPHSLSLKKSDYQVNLAVLMLYLFFAPSVYDMISSDRCPTTSSALLPHPVTGFCILSRARFSIFIITTLLQNISIALKHSYYTCIATITNNTDHNDPVRRVPSLPRGTDSPWARSGTRKPQVILFGIGCWIFSAQGKRQVTIRRRQVGGCKYRLCLKHGALLTSTKTATATITHKPTDTTWIQPLSTVVTATPGWDADWPRWKISLRVETSAMQSGIDFESSSFATVTSASDTNWPHQSATATSTAQYKHHDPLKRHFSGEDQIMNNKPHFNGSATYQQRYSRS